MHRQPPKHGQLRRFIRSRREKEIGKARGKKKSFYPDEVTTSEQQQKLLNEFWLSMQCKRISAHLSERERNRECMGIIGDAGRKGLTRRGI